LDLGLLQRDLASRLGVGDMTVGNWELGKERPGIRHTAAILAFLGYDPEPPADSLPGRLRAVRRRLGLTQAELAARLGQDEHQVCRWEGGRQKPHPWIAGRIDLGLRALEGWPVDGPEPPMSFFDLTRWRRKPPSGDTVRPRTFGERLRARRLRLGLSMAEVARRTGVSRTALYRLERGKQDPTDPLRGRLARVFSDFNAKTR
jgi:transcriptional regulator with XRE-family HTH domain